MTVPPIHILLIEDNPQDAQILRQQLANHAAVPYTLHEATQLAEGLAQLKAGAIDVILLDLQLPDSDGVQTLGRVLAQAPRVPIVILTAHDDEALIVHALQLGAQDYLVKGSVRVYPKLLWRSIRYAIERKHAQDALREAHAQTQKLLTSIPSILIGMTPEGVITHWNSVAERLFGVPASQVVQQSCSACGIRWDAARILDGLQACQRSQTTVELNDVAFTRPDGRPGMVGFTIAPMQANGESDTGFLMFGADITERKQAEAERARLQQELAQAQKMETIGRFAGSIAHDFNNFLQAILGFALVIRGRYPDDPQLLQDIQEIIDSTESAADVVRQLLAFSRRQPLEPTLLDLNQTIHGMARLLEHLVGERIELRFEFEPEASLVKVDPTSLKQILMNLAANARDAMAHGGQLTISTHRMPHDSAWAQARGRTTYRDFVRLSVQDTGVGLDPDMAEHLFEPFFTTKQAGRGTGLGLAVVYGLVQQHDGFIEVDTAPSRGTAFHLYFPEHARAADVPAGNGHEQSRSQEAGRAGRPAADAPRALRGRVLIVDDDRAVRLLCQRVLETAYAATSVSSGPSALELLAQESFDVLLTDLKMPGMDGFALLEEALKRQPGLRVIAMTGSLTTDMDQRLRACGVSCPLLRKPFNPDMLEQAIAGLL